MTTTTNSVERASNQDRTISTLVTAFSTDPVMRWLYPDPHQYLTCFPRFVLMVAGQAFDHNGAYTADDYRGTCRSNTAAVARV